MRERVLPIRLGSIDHSASGEPTKEDPMSRFSNHIRQNIYGLVAIFIALTMGTAYATHPGGTNTISTDDIQNQAVTTPKIATRAVETGKIQDQAVTNAKVALESITNNRIAPNAVNSGRLANGAVITNKLADGAVTTPKLADGAVTPAKHGVGLAARTFGASTDNFFCPPVPSGVATPIPFELVAFDTAGMWGGFSACGEAARLYAPRAGVYDVSAGLVQDANTTGTRYIAIRKNGDESLHYAGSRVPASSDAPIQNISALVDLAQGDYVELVLTQTSTEAQEHGFTDPRNFLAMNWDGPLGAAALASPMDEGGARRERR
jgi:hypothetical protein